MPLRASMPPRRPTSALNCFRACAGHTANSYCTVSPSLRDPFRGRIATQTSCLLLLTIVVIRSIPQLFPSPVRRRMLRRPSSMCTTQAVVRITHMSGHWSKPAISSPGVSSAVATVRVLRFSAMIIGPSRADYH